jgi:hypothetical protein
MNPVFYENALHRGIKAFARDNEQANIASDAAQILLFAYIRNEMLAEYVAKSGEVVDTDDPDLSIETGVTVDLLRSLKGCH